ncbi:ABC transporter permease subunit [Gracilinema caldarium]|uniref:ABC-type transporter, integral membrane subunit n=1 Tax=Gracilinema caldarium (strain ATCC 51460 / DSM 7334 / H1) TaxID=744872 RepID=F8EWR0_GRAC1|nr:ribose ABC transporter permease [Gracilinema caldarium]AEJ18296.1 ABC-type transporter, integral membrane subunit [Gracilinema caldarium DSM 7334]
MEVVNKTKNNVFNSRKIFKNLGIFPILIIISVLFSLTTTTFLSTNNLVNILRQASINIVLAVGMTLVILTGGIDLSVGSILATTAVIGLMTSLNPGLQWGTVIIPIIAGLLIGLINGLLIAYVKLPPFIATLGTMTTFRGVSYLLPDGTTIINNDLNFAWIGNNYLGPIPWLVVIAFIVVLLAWFLLRKTVLGVRIYAVGGNAQAARLTGIKVGFVLVFVYAVSGLLCGLGGVMTASRLYSASGLLGNGYELDAIAAVILGGTSVVGGIGGVGGTLVGALIMAVLNNGLTLMNVSFFWQMVIRGIVIILAVTIDKFRTKSST